MLSFTPPKGAWFANYVRKFFSEASFRDTIANTLYLAVPSTLINVLLADPDCASRSASRRGSNAR